MSEAMERIRATVERHSARMLDLKYTDLLGRLRHVTLPVSALGEELLERGVGVDGSSLAGVRGVESSDLRVVPDPATVVVDPFWAEPTLSLMGELVEASSDTPFPLDPRGVARRAEAYLVGLGVADRALFSPEPEFYVFDGVEFGRDQRGAYYRILEEPRADGYRAAPGGGYHLGPPADGLGDLRSEVALTLESMGLPVKYHHSENGTPGQSEIEVNFHPLLQAADALVLMKYVVKSVARRRGKTATFMPKPIPGQAGSGMHVHQKLFAGERPVFFDPQGYAGLSREALSYLGGLLRKSRPLCALVAPSANSYRRLVPGYEAPVSLAFSLGNRSTSVRIPAYAVRPQDKRIEYRPPDASSNPYLALSAMLMAGLWGIREGIDPVKEGFGPFDLNVYELETGRRPQSLPASLEEALSALESDHEFLLEGGVFTRELVQAWVALKTAELRGVADQPHPADFVTTYDC
ncbi:MAG: type I glutamate--ammonia ligase [Acetobacteraceae bacterium]|nr:type I glutamate--ammonia ligase [Acetobacteraceae bacterium]